MIETKDLLLNKGKPEDWHDMYINLWRHEESAKDMLWKPVHSEEEAIERMKKNLAFMDKNDLSWFVYEKKSGQAIGFAGMEKIAEGVYEDTGIAIGPDFVRKGYGKQILTGLMQEAAIKYGAKKFVCSCRKSNLASKQLQLSCGFTYTHSQQKTDVRNGETYVLDFYERDLQCEKAGMECQTDRLFEDKY